MPCNHAWIAILSVLCMGSLAGVAITSTMLVANSKELDAQPATIPCDWINATLQLSPPLSMYFDPTNATWDPNGFELSVETRRRILAASSSSSGGKSSSKPSSASSSSSTSSRTTSTGTPAPRTYTRASDGTPLLLGSYYVVLSPPLHPYSTVRNEIPMSSSQCQGDVAPINATYLVSCDLVASRQAFDGSYLPTNPTAFFQLYPAPTTMANPAIANLRSKRKPLVIGLCFSSVVLFVALIAVSAWLYVTWSNLPKVVRNRERAYWHATLASEVAFRDLHDGVVSDALLQRVGELRKEMGPYITGLVYNYYLSLHGPHNVTAAKSLLSIEIR